MKEHGSLLIEVIIACAVLAVFAMVAMLGFVARRQRA